MKSTILAGKTESSKFRLPDEYLSASRLVFRYGTETHEPTPPPLENLCLAGRARPVAGRDRPSKLASMPIEQLCRIKGIGEVKAATLAAALELGKRAVAPDNQPMPLATDDQVSAFLMPYLLRQEKPGYFLVMLNNRKELLATQEFSIRKSRPPVLSAWPQLFLPALVD